MELLLSSFVLNDDDVRRVGLPPRVTGRAGIVMNALDEYGKSRSRGFIREARTFAACGYQCEELDLRAYFPAADPDLAADRGRTPEALAARLAGLDLVWALGGNAFVLARAMNAAGFGEALRQQAGRAEFVYGGYSAGACVAGPDLQGIELMDDAAVVPEGYPSDARAVALGLVSFRVVPHWHSELPDAVAAERAAALLDKAGLPYRCLRDGQVTDGSGTVRTLNSRV